MVRYVHRSALVLFIVLALLLTACGGTAPEASPEASVSEEEAASADAYAGQRILWVESYHEGYAWADEIGTGLHAVLDDTAVELLTVHMDTKRNNDDAFCQQAGQDVLTTFEEFQPDLVIASDDNAQRCFVVPYLMDRDDLPVIFVGVNWDASIYDYPTPHITGMLEVDLIPEVVDMLGDYTEGRRVAYLSADTVTEQKTAEIYNERFFDGDLQIHLVDTFEAFKEAYLLLQEEADILLFGIEVGIPDWDNAEAEAFMLENARIPSGSSYTWMDPFVLAVFAKTGEEHGEWAGQTALQILDGTSPADIPVAENQSNVLMLNLNIAEQLDIAFSPTVLRNADKIYGSESTE
jgi:hypothetical protein